MSKNITYHMPPSVPGRFKPGAEVVIPPDVVRQVGPGYTHDPRYAVGEDEVFEGEFMAEWRRLRGRGQ